MTTGCTLIPGTCARAAIATAALLFTLPVFADAPGDEYPQNPQYPQTTPYPQEPPPGTVTRAPRMRDMFAATLATVLQATGQNAMMSVSQGLSGAINNWFVRKTHGAPPMAGSGYANPGYTNPSYTNPSYANNTQPPAAPGSVYPSYPTPNDPGTAPPAGGDSGYPVYTNGGDNSAGPASADNSYPGYPASNTNPEPYPQTQSIYAGIAYEVHSVGQDGSTTLVDPASHVFYTGDRFRVFYRPALPGRVDVFNINAQGQNTQIDTVQVAAGDLASLGPYEFSDAGGSETLILRLSPCATPALYAATRSIVKVQDAAPAPGAFNLSSCSAPSTRGIQKKTRSIRKVSVEGGTSFALDQIAPSEITSGQYDARQVTITLQHR